MSKLCKKLGFKNTQEISPFILASSKERNKPKKVLDGKKRD